MSGDGRRNPPERLRDDGDEGDGGVFDDSFENFLKDTELVSDVDENPFSSGDDEEFLMVAESLTRPEEEENRKRPLFSSASSASTGGGGGDERTGRSAQRKCKFCKCEYVEELFLCCSLTVRFQTGNATAMKRKRRKSRNV